ncbi:MAG: Gfo/Idh/MocA family oxidoreductase [Bacteroidota bacterium]
MSDQKHNIRRRKALKTLSMGALGLATAPQIMASCNSADDKKLGVALVGLGNYSNIMLGPALRATQNCRLSALVTGTPAKAQKWAADYNIPSKNIYNYDNFDEIAQNPDIDIVYVVLPNFMHAEYSIRALKAGKHVICEKPMAMNAEECRQMIKASQENDRLLSVGYRLHYELHHQRIMDLAVAKPFGPINFVEAGLAYHMPDPTIWRLQKELGGGGAVMDLGVYLIQGCLYAVGEEPIAVSARGFVNDTSRFKDIYETMTWQFEFPSGTISNCTTSYSSYVDRLHVSCYQNWYGLRPSFNGRGTQGYLRNEPMGLKQVNQQAAHMDDFANSILNNQAVKASGALGLRDMVLVDAIKRSADSGGKRLEL